MKFSNISEDRGRYVDEKWFKLFVGIGRPLLLNSFSFAVKEMELEKKLFLGSTNYAPKFIYRLDNLSNLSTTAIVALSDLRGQLLQEERDLSIQGAYLKKVDEAILEQKIILASKTFDWKDFNELNIERFGQISIESISSRIQNIKNNFNLLEGLELAERKNGKVITEDDLFEATRHFESWPNLLLEKNGDRDCAIDSSEVVEMWNNSLSKFSTPWQAVLSNDVLHIKVSSKSHKVLIPQGVKFPLEKVQSLYAHEVGVHVFRRENGKKTKLKLLSIGLANYDRAEEGICLMREQVVLKRNKLPSFDKYFALAYAVGAIDGKAKDFRSVYNMLNELFTKRLAKRFKDEDVERIAKDRAWNVTLRVFRGGDPVVPGCCFYRDKIYREGNIQMWDLFINSPEKFSYAKYGKFDPSNEEHMNLVMKYMS
ncbi:MAG: DUF1704 domain-containing protein [Oligoflexales bacterium]|nr:DUF1704 domain-containing protein [Oligoflexales bacterium]